MKKVKAYAMLLGIAGLVIALDQWTKSIVRTNLAVGEIWSPWDWLTPYARILHWHNTGAAFGVFPAGGQVFIIVAIIVSLAIIYYFPQIPAEQWGIRIAMSMQMGGALGNLIDRLLRGPVTDFFSVGNFAVFNVADASITVGVAVLLLFMWIEERKMRKADDQPAESSEIAIKPSQIGNLTEEEF